MQKFITASGDVEEGTPITETESAILAEIKLIIEDNRYRPYKGANIIIAKYVMTPRDTELSLPSEVA